MIIKYKSELTHIEQTKSVNCVSLGEYSRIVREGFRWTFSPITHPQNVIPRAKIESNPRVENDKLTCEGWSLSMFESQEKAINNFQNYFKSKPNIGKKIGTHLASGILEPTDGFCGPIGENGHFEFFELHDCDLSTKFNIISEL